MLKSERSTRARGFSAEKYVREYLQQQGLRFLESNFLCRMGEIDLIMEDGEIVVFVEVRMRNASNMVTGLESVDARKQKKLIKAAKFYLQQRGLFDKVLCRFDVAEVAEGCITWIRNAFE